MLPSNQAMPAGRSGCAACGTGGCPVWWQAGSSSTSENTRSRANMPKSLHEACHGVKSAGGCLARFLPAIVKFFHGRPVVLRVAPAHVLAHLGVARLPEPREVAGDLYRAARRGEQLEGDGHGAT